MAKRFNDTDIWEKEWFLKLSMKQKMIVKFLFDKCDCAGIYSPNFTLMSFYIGDTITEEDLKGLKQITKLPNGNYFIEDFIQFQYNVSIEELNPKFSVHKGVIKQLQRNNIRVNQPLPNPYVEVTQPLQDKDKVKDKDKVNISPLRVEEEKEKTNKKEKEENPDLIFDSVLRECFTLYEQKCPNLIPLRFERRNREILKLLDTTLNEIDRDVGQFEQLCIAANQLKTIAEKKIDFKTMLRNYIGIFNGKYKPPSILDGLDFG